MAVPCLWRRTDDSTGSEIPNAIALAILERNLTIVEYNANAYRINLFEVLEYVRGESAH